jgi:hypothetical protein
MTTIDVKSRFEAKLLRPAKPGNDTSWAFLVLPGDASERLPRRGRTTVEGTINAHHFQATLEPDGQLSHWRGCWGHRDAGASLCEEGTRA